MHRHRNPYGRPKVGAKAKLHEEDEAHRLRYLALFMATVLLALVVSANAHAADETSPRAAKVVWTDYNTHDPGQKVDPQKVQEMLADLAEEEAARKNPNPRDGWLLQSFGVEKSAQGY